MDISKLIYLDFEKNSNGNQSWKSLMFHGMEEEIDESRIFQEANYAPHVFMDSVITLAFLQKLRFTFTRHEWI